MSIPPLPESLKSTGLNRLSNSLHSFSIHLLRRARAADKDSGLSPERLSVLSVLHFAGPLPISRLASLEGVSAPAISRMMGGLEKDGYARRNRGNNDVRVVEAEITSKGSALVEKIRCKRIENISTALKKLSAVERQKLKDLEPVLLRLLST